MTEAEALADIEECRDDNIISNTSHRKFVKKRTYSILCDFENYCNNKSAKVGTTIICAENRCKKKFIKKFYQQAFCCIKHKNQFWNRQKLL